MVTDNGNLTDVKAIIRRALDVSEATLNFFNLSVICERGCVCLDGFERNI